MHALLYLILSLLSVAVIFFISGAPFAAGLELVIYAGAIMVFFIFVVMLLNLGDRASAQERSWLTPRMWPHLLGRPTASHPRLAFSFVAATPRRPLM